jgi:hypothetical protein
MCGKDLVVVLAPAGVTLVLVVAGADAAVLSARNQPARSDVCGECHRDIYRMWRASAHAAAMEDPIFLEAYRETTARDGAAAGRVCLSCHSPLVEKTGDFQLEKKVTWEGVSCEVCHGLVSVDLSSAGPKLVFDVGSVKRGPIRDATSTGHDVAFSELHTTSLACAGCHEYVNPEGTPIMTTYSEWKASRAAKDGKTCQSCHMGRTNAQVVDPRILRAPEVEVNLHEVPGGHSLEQLYKALGASILEPARAGDQLEIKVRLTNKGAGHAVPTGMPGRRVILRVQVDTSSGKSLEDQRVYEKIFRGPERAVIERGSGFFVPHVRLETDTRIRADEQRVESFLFAVPAADTAYVEVKLHYEHTPTRSGEGSTRLTFLSERRSIPPRS